MSISSAVSVEPGAQFQGCLVASSALCGPGTHPRSPLDSHGFARVISFDPGVHGYTVPRPPLWTPIDPSDLTAAGASALPTALVQLWTLVVQARWRLRLSWQATHDVDHPAGIGHPYATLEAARPADDASQPHTWWQFRYTWHTHPHGSYRLFGKLAQTPERPAWHDGPSLTAVRGIIAEHPARETSDLRAT